MSKNTTHSQVSDLISLNSCEYAETLNSIQGYDDYRSIKELNLDTIVEKKELQLQNHLNNKENYLSAAKYNIHNYNWFDEDYKDINKALGLSDSVEHNIAAIEAAKTHWVHMSFMGKTKWFESKEKDLINNIECAKERQLEEYSLLDSKYQEEADEEILKEMNCFVDNRTSEQCYVEHYSKEIEYLSEEELILFESIMPYNGIINWNIKWRLIEIYTPKFRAARKKLNILRKELNMYIDDLLDYQQLFTLCNWSRLPEVSRAENYFSIPKNIYKFFEVQGTVDWLRKQLLEALKNLRDSNKKKTFARQKLLFNDCDLLEIFVEEYLDSTSKWFETPKLMGNTKCASKWEVQNSYSSIPKVSKRPKLKGSIIPKKEINSYNIKTNNTTKEIEILFE